MSDEEWRAIPGYEGYYEVSTKGRVRSLTRTVLCRNGQSRNLVGRMLTPSPDSKGYMCVTLRNNKTCKVHVLMLATFVGPRPPGMYGRHLNDIKADNKIENLAYGTPLENNRDTIANGGHRQVNKTHCPYDHPYSGANLITRPRGRGCRACKRATDYRNYWRAKAERASVTTQK